jgi:ribonuclease HI
MDCKSLWVEENNIPFRKKYTRPQHSVVYEDCFFNVDNIDILSSKPESLTIVGEDHINDKLHISDVYNVYSDGGSFNNGGRDKDLPVFGSTATIVTRNGKEIWKHKKAKEDVTNNYCELKAGILGVKYILEKCNPALGSVIIMNSDSQYLMKGINEWLANWVKRGWKNNEGNPVSNAKLWKMVEKYINDKSFSLLTCWVRGHQEVGDSKVVEYNNECDYMCNEALNDILLENGLPTRKLKR